MPSSPATAPAARGTPTPRSAPCTCARSSISRSRTARAPCAPSPRSASRWCASTGAPTPASTATASCAASFHEAMFGPRLAGAFEEVKDAFDPGGLFNPGKIVRPERMDDRELLRYKPGYAPLPVETGLDWSEWGGFDRAVEMCNNNGACRKWEPGVMCPSYRVTMDEQHVTRGRANTLRLALTGQLGPDALVSDAMAETMALCVGCKGCKRECPTGVDMARMKIEYLHQRRKRHGLGLRDRLVASLPRYAPAASRLAWLTKPARPPAGAAGRDRASPGIEREAHASALAKRPVPAGRDRGSRRSVGRGPERRKARRPARPEPNGRGIRCRDSAGASGWVPRGGAGTRERRHGPRTHHAGRRAGSRALRRHLHHLVRAGERPRRGAGAGGGGLPGARRRTAPRRAPPAVLRPDVPRRRSRRRSQARARAHPHRPRTVRRARRSHRRSGALVSADVSRRGARARLRARGGWTRGSASSRSSSPTPPGSEASTFPCARSRASAPSCTAIATRKPSGSCRHWRARSGWCRGWRSRPWRPSCCGMAGAFGYEAANFETSMAMGELDLLPAVRAADGDTIIVAGGTSCRHQIGRRYGPAGAARGGSAGSGAPVSRLSRSRPFLPAVLLVTLLPVLLAPAAHGRPGEHPAVPDQVRAYLLWQQGNVLHVQGRIRGRGRQVPRVRRDSAHGRGPYLPGLVAQHAGANRGSHRRMREGHRPRSGLR